MSLSHPSRPMPPRRKGKRVSILPAEEVTTVEEIAEHEIAATDDWRSAGSLERHDALSAMGDLLSQPEHYSIISTGNRRASTFPGNRNRDTAIIGFATNELPPPPGSTTHSSSAILHATFANSSPGYQHDQPLSPSYAYTTAHLSRSSTATTANTERPPAGISDENAVLEEEEEEDLDLDEIRESGGLALIDARKALYGNHRVAEKRFYWTLPPEHDERVLHVLHWVEALSRPLASLGIHKFLSTRQRGALVINVDYRIPGSEDTYAVDWVTFEEAQRTFDWTLQESIATYDPLNTALIFVFLMSKSRNSLGIWRRKLLVPPALQAQYGLQIESLRTKLKRHDHVVHLEATSDTLRMKTPKSVTPASFAVPTPSRTLGRDPPPVSEWASIHSRPDSDQVMGPDISVTSLAPAASTASQTKAKSRWKKLFKLRFGKSKKS